MSVFSKEFWSDKASFVVAAAIGAKRLIEATALIIVSGYSIYGAYNYVTHIWVQRILLGAAAIIALRGSYEFLRYLARRDDVAPVKRKQ